MKHNQNCCLARYTPKKEDLAINVNDNQGASRAAAEKNYIWENGKTIYIKFLGGTDEKRRLVKKWASEWLKYANLTFAYVADTSEHSDVRISFDEMDGAWSYIGIVAEVISKEKATMNFGWIDKATVLHEFGHMLGLIHEHQNPKNGIKWDWEAIKADLSGPPNYWSDMDIRNNVTDQYLPEYIEGTEVDRKSIMMYPIPAHWTIDGFSAGYNNELSGYDKWLVNFLYPFEVVEPVTPTETETDTSVTVEPVEIEPVEPIITEEEPATPTPEELYLELGRKMYPTYRHLKTMREISVVVFANAIGINASTDDREIDTVRKIIRKLYPNKDVTHIH